MYKGQRDDHLTIRVPQRLCHLYKSKLDEEFVEVCLPWGGAKMWRSFMVKPSQVCYDYDNPDTYNIIEGLNRNTKIIISTKMATNNGTGRTVVPDSEIEYNPIDIKNMYL